MTDTELKNKHENKYLAIELEDVWSVKKIEYRRIYPEPSLWNTVKWKLGFRNVTYKPVTKTEYRNPSLLNALKDAGVEAG